MTMTVSNHQLVEYVRDHMNEVRWQESERGGFVGSVNDATVHVVGGEFSRSTLTVSADGEQYVIYEPQPLVDAPLGRWIRSFKKHVLRQEAPPPDARTQAALHLKKAINEIISHACKQVQTRQADPQGERKLRRRIWNKLTGDQGL